MGRRTPGADVARSPLYDGPLLNDCQTPHLATPYRHSNGVVTLPPWRYWRRVRYFGGLKCANDKRKLRSTGRDLHLMYSLIGDRRTSAYEANSVQQQPFVFFVV